MRRILAEPLAGLPGGRFYYSNAGYDNRYGFGIHIQDTASGGTVPTMGGPAPQ